MKGASSVLLGIKGLKDEELRREYEAKLQEKVNQSIEQADQLEKNIREAAEEVCGLTTGRRGRERETWVLVVV